MTTAESLEKRVVMDTGEVASAYGPFVMSDLTLWLEDFLVSGIVTNRTDRRWSFATFRLRLYDNDGKVLPYDDRFDGALYVKDLAPGESKPVTGLRGERPMAFTLRPEGDVAGFGLEFVPERSYFDSRMTFALVEPLANADLFFTDAWLSITFEVTRWEFRFQLRNRTDTPLTLHWSDAVFLDFANQPHPVVHGSVPLAQKDQPKLPTLVAPGETVANWVYPADRVAGSRVFNDWRLNPLLPPTQQAEGYVGKPLGLILPIESGGDRYEYRFVMQVAQVTI